LSSVASVASVASSPLPLLQPILHLLNNHQFTSYNHHHHNVNQSISPNINNQCQLMLDLAVAARSKAKMFSNNYKHDNTRVDAAAAAVEGDDLLIHQNKDHDQNGDDEYAEKNSTSKINFSSPKAHYFR
jgi:hypothetical protein